MNAKKLLRYDIWANARIYRAFSSLDPSKERSDIEKLFAHLLTTQRVWVHRIKGNPAPSEIWPVLTMEEMESLLKESPQLLESLIDETGRIVTYQNSKGESFQNSVEDILMHLIIHGQHHRAQISSLLRASGVTPPVTDFIFFLRTLEN
jgi:uncharacterized damage-inducible protein DinB